MTTLTEMHSITQRRKALAQKFLDRADAQGWKRNGAKFSNAAMNFFIGAHHVDADLVTQHWLVFALSLQGAKAIDEWANAA